MMMSKLSKIEVKREQCSNNNTPENIHDDEELDHSKPLRKQLLKVSKENTELIEEIDQLKKSSEENKAEIDVLKRMMVGIHSNDLALTALPEHEARTGSEVTIEKADKIHFAKLPKVIESVSGITTFSQACYDKILNFSFGPEQPDRKLSLSFTRSTNHYQLKKVTIYTDRENVACLHKCDYFLRMCAFKDDKPTDDQQWFQITTNNSSVKSSRGYVTLKMDPDAIQIIVGGSDFEANNKGTKPQIDITVSMSLFLYDSTTSENSTSTSSTPSASLETRAAKLLDYKTHMNSTVKIYPLLKCVPDAPFIAEKTLLDSGSLILNTDFKSPKPFHRAGIFFSLTQKGIDAFSNWVYGMDTTVFVDDIPLNMEVLLFAQHFWICDLVQFCIDNMCQTLMKNFTFDLLIELWRLEEKHKIRSFGESLEDVIKVKGKRTMRLRLK